MRIFLKLRDVFGSKGYHGSSYSDLMKATGLVKASLYPGGKAEMVDAILSEVDCEFSDYVVKPAFEEGKTRSARGKLGSGYANFTDAGNDGACSIR